MLLLAFIFCQAFACQTSPSVDSLYPEALQQDFILFRRQLEKEHAGLYRYRSKSSMDKVFDSCFRALNHPESTLEFARSVLFVTSFIEDGHTGTNISRMMIDAYSDREKMFPLRLYFIGQKAYVLCNAQGVIPPGSEILSIDNMTIDAIREFLFHYLPSDGKIRTKKERTLNNGAFPFLYRWLFGSRNSFTIRYKAKGEMVKTKDIPATLVKDFDCNEEYGTSNTRDLQLDFLPDCISLMTIRTFDDNRLEGAASFETFLDSSFQRINAMKSRKLIIDLRGNAGGMDANGALLYTYLANRPFSYFHSITTSAGNVSPTGNPLLGVLQPQKACYTGAVFLLIDGLSFSTTADVCAIAKSNRRGVFIGEETGGAYYGNTSGQTIRIELPNSKIAVIIPRFMYVNAVGGMAVRDRGILPDYPVVPTIDEVRSRKDVILEFAVALAQTQ